MNHENLHARAVETAREYLKREAELVGIFQELDTHRTFERFGMPSLFAYATKVLGLSEATTTALTSIARAARKVPELKSALEEKKISFSNARRIAPVLKTENKSEWLEKAAHLSVRALEHELAKSFPDRPAPTRAYPKSETLGRLEVDLPHATLAKLKRVQEVLSQKKKAHVDAAGALDSALSDFLGRHDPLERARRLEIKAGESKNPTALVRKPVTRPVENPRRRFPAPPADLTLLARQMGFPVARKAIPASEKHAVTLRDGAQCTHHDPTGARCESRQWLQFHHEHRYAAGGANTAANLRMLCSQHHVLLHR